ncbi:MAG: HupE/UreJ family protein [Candidatus Berkiella sp.]
MKKNDRNHTYLHLIFYILLFIYPTISFAHPNHLGYLSFSEGFLHPLTGMDHALAMIAIGILAGEKGRNWVWFLPTIFISFMILGGILGYMGILFPWFELGITLSVFVLGLCISFPNFLPSIVILSIVPAFALCHGFAHGSEIPLDIRPLQYVLGFIVATALLHLLGIMISKILIPKQSLILRFSGLAMAASIFWL